MHAGLSGIIPPSTQVGDELLYERISEFISLLDEYKKHLKNKMIPVSAFVGEDSKDFDRSMALHFERIRNNLREPPKPFYTKYEPPTDSAEFEHETQDYRNRLKALLTDIETRGSI